MERQGMTTKRRGYDEILFSKKSHLGFTKHLKKFFWTFSCSGLLSSFLVSCDHKVWIGEEWNDTDLQHKAESTTKYCF
jgi:hypothetical protein